LTHLNELGSSYINIAILPARVAPLSLLIAQEIVRTLLPLFNDWLFNLDYKNSRPLSDISNRLIETEKWQRTGLFQIK
jgi:hypothetical protein